jgi:hypothetical protein
MSFDTKSLLAKLMATENLIVEQRKVHTAYFDVLNRILVVPILDENISPQLYDLFVGHEVGHALYTPVEGMRKAKEEKYNMSVINVVEDARIERKIKNKYPGLKNSFVKAYKELVERDFFELNDKDINQMNFIDRVNMHFKVGASLAIRFSDEERELVEAVDSTETYEDVMEVTKRIIDYMKTEKEKSFEEHYDGEDYYFDEDFSDSEDSYDSDDSEEGSDDKSRTEESNDAEEGKKISEGDDGSESVKDHSQKNKKKDTKGQKGSNNSEVEEDNIRSLTDEAYKKNENKLFDSTGIEYSYVNLPKIDSKQCVFDFKELYDMYLSEGYSVDIKKFNEYRKESNKVVSYLVKEFEMRKNADQMKRASVSKTGELNLNRIYSYQFAEDLFKKVTVVPNGKSHGLVMFLDWSGSMVHHIANTVKQLLNLALFCKKANIPFEVYSFLDETFKQYMHRPEPIPGNLFTYDFSLANILSSRMSPKYFSIAGGALMRMAGIGYHRPYTPTWLSMHGTPLNETIIAAMEIIPEFQNKNKLQVVNTVFLTDGEGGFLSDRFLADGAVEDIMISADRRSRVKGVIVRDPKTKHQEIFTDRYMKAGEVSQTSALIKLLKKRTGCNVIGFYVANTREFRNRIYTFFPGVNTMTRQDEFEKISTQFRKEKYVVVESAGFDEYYVLRSNSLDTEEETEFVVKENATTRSLVSAFSKYTGNRVNNRVILNRFIGLIA